MTSFPGFAPGLPPLPTDAKPLSAEHRAFVDALPEHKRFEAEHSLRTFAAIFARGVKADEDRTSGMTEALRAKDIHWTNRKTAAAKIERREEGR